MKTMILATILAFGTLAFAETKTYVKLVDNNEQAIMAAVAKINAKSNCDVYAVETGNPGYRADAQGNLSPVGSKAAIKFRCVK